MRGPRAALIGWLLGRLARLRFPTLFLISAVLLVVTLVIPDPLPFADEILLGLATALLASWSNRSLPGETTREGDPTPASSGR